MKRPEFLKPGDTIGFCAPSFGAATEPYVTRMAAALKRIEARGYQLKIAPSTYKSDGLGISTDPEDAAEDLMDLYLDPEVKAIISVGGGELMNETISKLDFETLAKAAPKWYMGYSDNTNFLHPMITLADVPGIYGPCATGFGKEWEATEEDAFALLEGTSLTVKGYEKFELPWNPEEAAEAEEGEEEEDPLAPYDLNADKVLTSFLPEGDLLRKAEPDEVIRMEGVLLGGCLDVLDNLSGTKYDGTKAFIKKHGSVIWALEACDLNVMSIRRTIWHLDEMGWFDTAAGFLIGRPLAGFGQEMMGVDQYNAVTDILKSRHVPVICDADIGHVKPMMPIMIGSHAKVTVKGNDLTIEQTLV